MVFKKDAFHESAINICTYSRWPVTQYIQIVFSTVTLMRSTLHLLYRFTGTSVQRIWLLPVRALGGDWTASWASHSKLRPSVKPECEYACLSFARYWLVMGSGGGRLRSVLLFVPWIQKLITWTSIGVSKFKRWMKSLWCCVRVAETVCMCLDSLVFQRHTGIFVAKKLLTFKLIV